MVSEMYGPSFATPGMRLSPAVHQVRGVQRADEREVEQQVEHGSDDHGDQQRPGNVALRVLGFAADLDRLLEAFGREDDAGGERRQDAVGAVRSEAAAGGEVAGCGTR